MGNLHLVTGYAGYQHITAEDQGKFNANMFGSGQYVLATDNRFEVSFTNSNVTGNRVTVGGGEILMQGRYIRSIGRFSTNIMSIQSGAQGMYRHDLIVVRYIKDGTTGVEEADLCVITGTPSATEAVDPEYTVGDIAQGGATKNEMPLYRVVLEGTSIREVQPLFEVAAGNLLALEQKVNTHKHSASDINEGIMPTTHGGTGRSSYTENSLLYASSSEELSQISKPTTDHAVLQQNKTGAPYWTTFNQLLSDIGSARIAAGSYTGNGKHGVSNANSITCGFTPKLVIVSVENPNLTDFDGGNPWIYGMTAGSTSSPLTTYDVLLTWNSDGVSWYSTLNAPRQLNVDGVAYCWVALG